MTPVRILVEGEDVGAEPDLVLELRVERVRQAVHAAGDLLHVDVRPAEVLAQDLDERVVHVGLEEVHDREVLDRALRPALRAQELVERVLVVLADDVVPGRRALALDQRPEVADRRLPQLVGGPPALVVVEHERQPARVARPPPPSSSAAPPRWTSAFGLPITNGRIGRPNSSQYRSVRSWARGMRMPPASAYRPGANVRSV